MKKLSSGHVIGFIFIAGLAIYFLTRGSVQGTVSIDTGNVVVTSSKGTVGFGTELAGS
jgi:hypothetical protein